MVGRSLEASLNLAGERSITFHDHLGGLLGIDMAQWWRPSAVNYFDRVPKRVILDALGDVGGPELSGRFASVKKGDLAASAERVFAGTYITDKWYMGYTGRLGGAEEGENTYGVRVEYQVSPNVSVEGEYGDQRKGADLIWSRDY